MNLMNLCLLIFLVILSFLIPFLLRRYIWKQLALAVDREDYEACFRVLDSFLCRLNFPASYRETIRLSALIAQNRKEDVQKQVDFLISGMKLKPQDKIQVLSRAFYYFLEIKDKKAAWNLLQLVKKEEEKKYTFMKIEYDILLEKKTDFIDSLKEKIHKLEAESNAMTAQEKNILEGYYKYLIGLQYGYLKKKEEKETFLMQALELCKGTMYEEQIRKEME